jgi:hypothetical protein
MVQGGLQSNVACLVLASRTIEISEGFELGGYLFDPTKSRDPIAGINVMTA